MSVPGVRRHLGNLVVPPWRKPRAANDEDKLRAFERLADEDALRRDRQQRLALLYPRTGVWRCPADLRADARADGRSPPAAEASAKPTHRRPVVGVWAVTNGRGEAWYILSLPVVRGPES